MEKIKQAKVLVSSAFAEEREKLLKDVFPEIRRFAQERQVEFVEIDPQWCTTQQEADSAEIPLFFIGILGHTYEEVLEELQKKLRQNLKLGTDMRALFYVKESGIKQSEHAFNKTRELIEEVKSLAEKHPNIKVRYYRNPDHLAQMLEKDLKEGIEELFPLEFLKDYVETIREQQRAYAKTKLRLYIPNENFLKEALDFLKSEGGYFLIIGKCGVGKSSFLAHLYERIKEEYKDTLLIEHYTFANSEVNVLWSLLKRFVDELENFLGKKDGSNRTSIDLESEESLKYRFNELLLTTSMQGKRVVIFLDEVDRLFSSSSRDLRWLIPKLPKGVYIFLTNTYEVDYLKPKKVLEIKGFDRNQAQEYIKKYLSRYGKKLDDEHIELILNAPQTTNPLFLKALLEELMTSGDYKSLTDRIKELLSAQTRDELFEKIFERYEKDYGDFVKDVLVFLQVSRDGLSESELLEILEGQLKKQVSRRSLSSFLLAIDEYMINLNGRLKPAHKCVEWAIKNRYQVDTKDYRVALIQYYLQENLKDTPKAYRELPWQAYELEDGKLLLKLLCNERLLLNILETEGKSALSKYMNYLMFTESELIDEFTNWAVKQSIELRSKLDVFITESYFANNAIKIYESLLDELEVLHYRAIRLYEGALYEMFYDEKSPERVKYYVSKLIRLANAYKKINIYYEEMNFHENYWKAEELYKEAIQRIEKFYKEEPQIWIEDYINALNGLGKLYKEFREDPEAANVFERILKLVEEFYEKDPQKWVVEYIFSLIDVGEIYGYRLNKRHEVREISKKVLMLINKLYREDQQEWTIFYEYILYKLGELHDAIDDYKWLMRIYKKIIKFHERLYKKNPKEWITKYMGSVITLRDLYRHFGNDEKAMELYEKYYELRKLHESYQEEAYLQENPYVDELEQEILYMEDIEDVE